MGTNEKLTAAVEAYFTELSRLHASGGATGERSSYGPLHGLLSAVGAALKPKVYCVQEPADQGAGHPDFALYAARQVQKGRARGGQLPECGVVEVKSLEDDAWLTAEGDQVTRYWGRYRLVLVTNGRDFVLVGEDATGLPTMLEPFRLAGSAEDFRRKVEKPRSFAREVGSRFGEYLVRALSHRAALAEPKDLAWLLASYARDGLARVEAAGDAPQLAAVIETAEAAPDALYGTVEPIVPLGLPFVPTATSAEWFDWPSLPDLFPVSFPGVNTGRDGLFVDIDLDRLRERIAAYFDATLSHEQIGLRYPTLMKSTPRYDAGATRDALLKRAAPTEAEFVRFAYRPFDNRWLYWEKEGLRLDRPRPDLRPNVFESNSHLAVNKRETQEDFSHGNTIRHLGGWKLGSWGIHFFPLRLCHDDLGGNGDDTHRANLSEAGNSYLRELGLGVEDLFHHVLATLHDPAYRGANAGALRMEWPRIPLPGWPDGGDADATDELARSAARGRELAALLDPDTPVPGVTQAPLRPGLAAIAVPATLSGRNMAGRDFAVTAGWGHFGQGDAVMPGQGRAAERAYAADECEALGDALAALGDTTFDIYLNEDACWRNVPAAVWNYRLGGYQVLKKWMSYREQDVLGRALRPEEVQHFTDTARRIAAILLLTMAAYELSMICISNELMEKWDGRLPPLMFEVWGDEWTLAGRRHRSAKGRRASSSRANRRVRDED